MFINTDDVRRLAFFSYIDENLSFDSFIYEAETTFIIPVVSQALYDAIITNPGNYNELVENYLKPCISFYAKYCCYNAFFNENFYGSSGLNDVSNSHPSLVQARLKMLIATFKFAHAYETAMVEFIVSQNYQEYSAPDPPVNPDPYPDPEPDPEPTPTGTHKLLAGFYI